MLKKIILLLFLVSTVFTAPPYAASEKMFKDLPKDHWCYNEINSLVKRDIIGGYNDGTVRPNNSVTREELAKLTFSLFPAAMNSSFLDNLSGPNYPDIYDRWGTPFLKTATYLMPGYTNGKFEPSKPATRRDVAILLLYGKLIQEGFYQYDNGELNILIPLPRPEVWNELQKFKEYSNIKENYQQSSRHLEEDPDNSNFLEFAGQFYSKINNVAFMIDQKLINGYTDKSLRLDNQVTRAEACALAKRMEDMDLSVQKEFLLEPPALHATPHTTKINKDTAHSVMVELGQWYNKEYPDLRQRAEAIYRFIVFNFDYNWDYRAGISNSVPTDLYSTLSDGTGTHVNFTNLLATLAKYSGLEATIVSGKAQNPTDSGPHTWVEIAVNGDMITIDPTYGVCTGKIYFDNFKNWEEEGYKWIEEKRNRI